MKVSPNSRACLLALLLSASCSLAQPFTGCVVLPNGAKAEGVQSGVPLRIEITKVSFAWYFEHDTYNIIRDEASDTSKTFEWTYTPTFTADGECIQLDIPHIDFGTTIYYQFQDFAKSEGWEYLDHFWIANLNAPSSPPGPQALCPYGPGGTDNSELDYGHHMPPGGRPLPGSLAPFSDIGLSKFWIHVRSIKTNCQYREFEQDHVYAFVSHSDFTTTGDCSSCDIGGGGGNPPDEEEDPDREEHEQDPKFPEKPVPPDPNIDPPEEPDPRDDTWVPPYDPEECPECPLLERMIGQLDIIIRNTDYLPLIHHNIDEMRQIQRLIYDEAYATAELMRESVYHLRNLASDPEDADPGGLDNPSDQQLDPSDIDHGLAPFEIAPPGGGPRGSPTPITGFELSLAPLRDVFPDAVTEWSFTVDISWIDPIRGTLHALWLLSFTVWALLLIWRELYPD